MFLLLSFFLFCGCIFGQTIEYTYDGAGRLIQAKYSNGKYVNYSYDARGNLLKKEIITGGATHTVSKPGTPEGPSTGKPQDILNYQTGNSQCSQGHEVEYAINWGDGTGIVWGNAVASHAYQTEGNYDIQAQARCKASPTITSEWSNTKSVNITDGGNQPPVAPELVFPQDNETNVPWEEVTFSWKKTTDPENDPITYNLIYSKDPLFGDCGLPNINPPFIFGLSIWGILSLLSFCFLTKSKNAYKMLCIILLLLVMACKDAGKENKNDPGVMSQTVRNLVANTRYFWRVEVEDNQGNKALSPIRIFITKN